MIKKFIKIITVFITITFVIPNLTVFANDTPFDGGSGATGVGSYDNGWVVSPGLYDADGIRVYLVQGGKDANGNEIGNGHRVDKIVKNGNTKVLKVIDLSNQTLPLNMWNSGGKTKSDYKYNGITLGASGTWNTVYNYEQIIFNDNKLPKNKTTINGTVVGWGETATESETRINAIKNWFEKENKKNWYYVLGLFGVTGDEAALNSWYLAFEPVIYFRFLGENHALTPTECAVYNQYLKDNGKTSLVGNMNQLTHQNAPLSIYPTTNLFKSTAQYAPAWTGAKSTKTSIPDIDIKTYLGIGYVLPPIEDIPIIDPDPPSVILNATITAEPDNEEVKGNPGEAASLGKNATITVDVWQTPSDLQDWKDRLEKVKEVDIYMEVKAKQLPNTSVSRVISCLSPTNFQSMKLDLKNKVTFTKSQFINLIDEAKGYKLKFKDPCNDVKLNNKENIAFEYTFTMKVEFIESDKYKGTGNKITVTSTPVSDDASFYRNEPPIPEIVGYISNPSTYSEIKQGTIGNEQFEAMAGTPTTRDLYLGTGGSEFIVDFEAALLKENTAKRTYRVHYDQTECEFKEGDQAKEFTFPSPTGGGSGNTTVSSMHSGGSCTVTWTGTTPWTGSGGVSGATAWVNNSWNDSSYNTALAAAQAYAATVNGTVYKYTAASDKVTRSFSSWGASASGSNPHISGSAQNGQEYIAPTPPDKDGKGADPGQPFIAGQYTPGQPNNWTITVSWTAPAHTNCGTCHLHDLPAVNDTWTQEIPYDYFDITKAEVWKIEQSYLNGLKTLTGTDSVLTQILQGNPTIFSNIAATETSRDGRFRYSVEPQMHDTVVWNKGTRSNKCDKQSETWGNGIKYNVTGYPHEAGYLEANATAKDKLTPEYAEFKANREKLVEVTVISDLLILQTSSGDQSVLYFDKKSNKVQTQQDYAHVKVEKTEGWDNNTKSAAKWTAGHINIGSYNGKYNNTGSKYTGNGSNNKIATAFDSDPADTITRTARPSSSLRIAKYNIDIIDTTPNGYYKTGTARTFWELALDYNPTNKAVYYSRLAQSLFGNRKGYVKNSNYSPTHTKINDIVIHDPVSAEYALILETDTTRDQRTADSSRWAENAAKSNDECPGNPSECEFRYLSCKYTGTNYHTVNCYTATTPETPNSHYHTVSCVDTAKMQQAFQPVSSSQTFNYTGNVQTFTAPSTGTYTFEVWGAQGGGDFGGLGGYSKGSIILTTGQTVYIYAGGNPTINNGAGGWNGGGTGGALTSYGGGGATDIRIGGTSLSNRFIVAGGGGGSAGGYNSHGTDSGHGGVGGGTSGGIGTKYMGTAGEGGTQTAGGAAGTNSYAPYNQTSGTLGSGGNGGGGYYGGGGGGGTYSPYNDGSGGGGGSGYIGGVTNGSMQSGVNSGNGKVVISYQSGYQGTSWGLVDLNVILVGGNIQVTNAWLYKQPKNAVIFKCGNVPYNTHICDSYCSHTPVLICTEPHHDGTHYDITNEICWSACKNNANHRPKTTAVAGGIASGGSAGYFINLDWGFQIYFPTVGNFYESTAYGISSVTRQRGKGFVNNMETAEWVKTKRVKFSFDVIYCGTATSVNKNGSQHGNAANGSDNHKHTSSCKLYKAETWIDLPKDYELFNFYCPASNNEEGRSRAFFEVTAINSPNGINDNTETTNRYRDTSYKAKHGAEKMAYTDIVGRIGNLIMEDTGDYRLSNLFKTPVSGNTVDDYIVQGIIKNVDSKSKNYVLAGKTDIRGLAANTAYGQDTYGLLSWLRNKTLTFPITPAKNNIQALKHEPLRVGYNVFLDIETLGKSYSNIEVNPYYYYYDLTTQAVSPLDVYINAPTGYEPINLFGNTDMNKVYPYTMSLNLNEQAERRNVTASEKSITAMLGGFPSGEYKLGNAQGLSFGESARTYIGSTSTLGVNQNIGGVVSQSEFQQSVKRWHFTLGLPSSAVFVDKGMTPIEANIAKYKNGKGVILMTADISANGGLYKLGYNKDSDGHFQIGNSSYPIPGGLPNVIAVYNGDGKTSRNDVEIHKTH